MKTYLLDLAAAEHAGPAIAGGKAYGLGRLHRYGLPVPDMLVLTAAACRDALGEDFLAQAIPQAERRSQVASRPLPPELAAQIEAALSPRGWLERPLAVRSSATQEDSRSASFAGLHQSRLHVRGLTAVLDAIPAVWASQWSDEAAAYRAHRGLPPADGGMAVVIMPMIEARCSGIAFSCHPLSGRDDQVVISAISGLADQLVAGAVNGEEIVLTFPRDITQAIAIQRDRSAILSDEEAQTLARLVRDAAQALDLAEPWYDFEWTWDGRHFQLVQARPITTHVWPSYPGLSGQGTIWSNGNTRDVVPDVMDAFDWGPSRQMVNLMLEQGWRRAGYRLLPGAQRAALIQGRLYLNVSLLQWEGYDALGIQPALINRMMGGHHPDIVVPPATLRQKLRRLGHMLRYAWQDKGARRNGRAQVADTHARAAQWRREDLSRLDGPALAERMLAQAGHVYAQLDLLYLQGSSGGSLSMLMELLERHLPGEAAALSAALLAGGPPSVTAQQSLDLLALSALARQDQAASSMLRAGADWRTLPAEHPFRLAFAAFLERYGHRGIYETYVRSPRWREQPGYLLEQITALMQQDPDALRQRQQAAQQAAWQRLNSALPWGARIQARLFLRKTQVECNDREAARSAFSAFGEAMRLLALEIGQRLTNSGHLGAAAQTFQLLPEEMIAALHGQLPTHATRHRVQDRLRQAKHWQENPAAEVVLDGKSIAPPPILASDASWRGLAIGVGQAQGAARLIRHPSESARLAPGDVLVAPSTDPAWTPLLLKAGALVMETGGYLSHGAIVARELCIPAVANLPGILAQLQDGQPLAVDGWCGTVSIVNTAPSQR
ncbi:PEP/pyruvate-binding domain-containing protein [Paludibacterium purpuratum]|uniref:Pyruvate,water dikinase n=1 Tax=Paludibacterium purpuratum TaxID=1144873 RepID=A0A4V3DV59_9NEIS|nr:PEP/pyruvate-binding domain-containing protein [Paludibacterium purpuratum]TDR79719.1 pyruvate,water dikinase [Paludibacterium purpuratum]